VEVDVQSLQALEAAVRQLEQTVAAMVSEEMEMNQAVEHKVLRAN
jgi:hypothetical protein